MPHVSARARSSGRSCKKCHRRIGRAEGLHRISGVGIGEHDGVRGRQSAEIVAAWCQLVRTLAIGGTSFRDGLIKAHQRSAAAVGVCSQSTCASLFWKRVFMQSAMKPRLLSSVHPMWFM